MILGEQKYLLRWRFDFLGKPSKFGMWNAPGPTKHGAALKAWATNKENLVAASIEGKDIYSREVKTLAACEGHNFVNMKWYAAIFYKTPGNYPGKPIGMILQTRDLDVLYLIDGQYATKDRTAQDKEFNYAGFGK